MAGITSYNTVSSSLSSATQTQSAPLATGSGATAATQVEGSGGSSSSDISTLARQLADAAARADARDSNLSRKELAQKASAINKLLVEASYTVNHAKYASESPDTDDPQRIARAQQAMDYVNGKGSNPFKGLSQEQLTLIIYDESGDFTVNERIAAWDENYEQRENWSRAAAARAVDEYNRTFKITNALKESLAYYENLPLIEQVQYPEDYAARLQERIDQESNRVISTADNGNLTKQLDQLLERRFIAN